MCEAVMFSPNKCVYCKSMHIGKLLFNIYSLWTHTDGTVYDKQSTNIHVNITDVNLLSGWLTSCKGGDD